MRRFGKFLGRILVIFVIVIAVMLAFAPREKIDTRITFAENLTVDGLDDYFAVVEAEQSNITPGTQKRVVWAGAPGVQTPVSIVYLHGFSATSEEIRPLPDLVAKALGANLIFTRLTGHGQDGKALARAKVGDWYNDMAEALAAARVAGDRVVIIGTSTGGTLAALAALDPTLTQSVEGIVFISPNFALVNAAATILTWPAARWWVPLVAGVQREFDPSNEDQARYWTMTYPSVAVLPMAALVKYTFAQDYSAVTLPALFVYSDKDKVVRASATRKVAERWGGLVTLAPQKLTPGSDPNKHVIAGDILSPDMTEPTARIITEWIRALPE